MEALLFQDLSEAERRHVGERSEVAATGAQRTGKSGVRTKKLRGTWLYTTPSLRHTGVRLCSFARHSAEENKHEYLARRARCGRERGTNRAEVADGFARRTEQRSHTLAAKLLEVVDFVEEEK
jgi:hypothetical protein